MFVSGKRGHKFESMELSILRKAETEYRLGKLQDDLKQKLEILHKDLSIKEQILTAEKQLVIVKKHKEMVEKQEAIQKEQMRLNRNIFYFTIITLAGVSAQLIGLLPVNRWFTSYEGSEVASEPALFLPSQLVLALAFTFGMVLMVKYLKYKKDKK